MKFSRLLFFIVILLFNSEIIFVQSGTAQTPPEIVKAAFPHLMAIYSNDVNRKQAQYVFALDNSSSMKAWGPEVITNFKTFIDALPDGDRVTIIEMGTPSETKPIGIPYVQINNQGRNVLKQQINGLKFDQNESDGFTMTSQVIKELNKVGSPDLKYVFMFSDFLYYTKRNKEFKNREDWASLKSALDVPANAYCLKLPLKNPNQNSDITSELNDIFRGSNVLPLTSKQILASWFTQTKADILTDRLKSIVEEKIGEQNKNVLLNAKIENGSLNVTLDPKNQGLFQGVILDQNSMDQLQKRTFVRPLVEWTMGKKYILNVIGQLTSNFDKELTRLGIKQKSISMVVEVTPPPGIIPGWVAYPVILFLLICFYQLLTIVKRRKFIGDISFYPPKGFQGSFRNIDNNLNNISTAIVGDNVSDSSYGKAIEVKNNLGANTEFTIKAKKRFFGDKVIEIKALSGFALEVISIEKKIRIISVGTKSKFIKPASVWSINKVEVTMPRVR